MVHLFARTVVQLLDFTQILESLGCSSSITATLVSLNANVRQKPQGRELD